MRLAIFKAMALGLMRDRAGLAMAFALPPLVYLLFAAVFAAASTGDLTVRLAVVDDLKSAQSERLVRWLFEDQRLSRVPLPSGTAAARDDDQSAPATAEDQANLAIANVVDLVRSGAADVGLVIRRDGRPLDDISQDGKLPLVVVANPARAISLSITEGILQDAYFNAIPEAALRSVADQIDKRFAPFTDQQRQRVERGLTAMGRSRVSPVSRDGDLRLNRVYETRNALPAGQIPIAVIYYAGAVTIMFLLFSALTGAMSLLEERETGLLDRLATSPGGPGVVIDGKFLFLVLQGLVQATIIFAVAWLGFGVRLPDHAGVWFVTVFASAIAAAGLALAFVASCRTRQQAHTLGQMGIVILAAIGGSMVPRYLMPAEIQVAGWATPTTWTIEAVMAIFHRSEPATAIVVNWCVLAVIGVAGLIVARILVRRAL